MINEERALPRVLIIGQTFTTDTGGGITLSNLFKNWPKDNLAVAVESKETVDFSRADSYYRIGYDELKMPFPFFAVQRKTASGPITEAAATGATVIRSTGKAKGQLKGYFDRLLHHSGLFLWMYGRQKVTGQFLKWVGDFKPDLIYYQPNSYKSIDFAIGVAAAARVPMVIHVMDDWFSFIIKKSPLRSLWQQKLDQKVSKLIASSQLHLSICNYMSASYLERYGQVFYPFHNTVDAAFWDSGKIPGAPLANPVNFLYAGRIGYGVDMMLLKVADVIEKMGREGQAISLDIQTKDLDHPLVSRLKTYQHVHISGPLAYKELPGRFGSADVLLIPCDFDGEGLKFIKYSMPTKVSEYMASGTPVLVVGPVGTALVNYALEGWARVCISDKETEIEKALAELITSAALRKKITETGKILVGLNHDEKHIVTAFRHKLSELANISHTV